MGGNGRTSSRRGFRALVTVALVVVIASLAHSCQGLTFNRCERGCSASAGRGRCGLDGVCACEAGWAGLACDVPTPSVVKESRLDGTAGYEYDTAGTAYDEKYVEDVMVDTRKNVIYVYAQDANGTRVIEVDPRYPETFTSNAVTARGWGQTNGPRRETTGAVPLSITPLPNFCGIGISSGCAAKHPRAYGHVDPQKSRGWYGVYAKMAADLSTALTGVVVPVNMWHQTTANQFRFSLFKYVGTTCSSDSSQWANCVLSSLTNGQASATFSKEQYILDAMGTDPANGMIVYKATHEDGLSRSVIGHVDGSLNDKGINFLAPGLLSTKCPTCSLAPDAMRLETSVAHTQTGVNYVIFAGSALLDDSDGKTFYPTLFKVNTNSGTRDGDGVEMYLDSTNVKVLEACEGQLDSKQGRFSTFTAITKHNGYGYVGTSGRDGDCPGCKNRAACIFMFDLNFAEGDSPLAVIALDAALGERDALSATVQTGATAGEKDFMYWAVGSRESGKSRIVKIEIGGTDTSSACISGCFKRVGTFEESHTIGGISAVPGERSVFAVSSAASTTYTKYSTVIVSGIEPTHISALTSGTPIKIHGSGFYSPTLASGMSHSISCRFGHTYDANNGFSKTSWSPATYVSATELSCMAPSASNSNSSTIGYSEVQISFDGLPTDSSDPTSIWTNSLWNSGQIYLRYHDPAVIISTKIGSDDAKVLLTGEDADLAPVLLRILGGPFLNSPDLKCKFNDNTTSVTSAVFVSSSEIKCPVCNVVNGRCANPVGSPLPWLTNGQPQDAQVAVALNGIDYVSGGILKLHGPPVGVKLLSGPDSHQARVAATDFSLGTFKVGLVDINGTEINYDRGQGGTKGYTISASISGPSEVAITEATSSVQTSDGIATFTPQLSSIPTAGEYVITFTATDCTNDDGACSDDLGVLAHAYLSVTPGSSGGLKVTPGAATENSMISSATLFPTDVVVLDAARNVSIGHLTVDIVDIGGSMLQTLSLDDVTVQASLVTGTLNSNEDYRERSIGAQLTGTLNKTTNDGRVSFSDLRLVAMPPSGSRAVGSTDDITYSDATRGDFGEASKYIVQFTTTLNGVRYRAHSIMQMEIGEPSYLRINGTYSKRTVYAEAPKQSVGEIIIGAYDGGNNFVGAAEITPRTVTVHASAGITLDGTLQVKRDDSGVWRFSDLKVVGPVVGEFGLTFSSGDLTPVLQVVNVLAGDAGYELASSQSILSSVTADQSVGLGSFTVYVQDMLGNSMGTADRHSTTDAVAPNRTIQVTCETLKLSGTTAMFTNGNGQVSFTGLIANSPKVGTHTLNVIETGAEVSGELRVGKLQSTVLTVSVLIGAVSGFKVTSPKVLEFSPSFTESIQLSEATAYSAGHSVPLDDFVVVPVDGAGNESPTGTLPNGVTLTAMMNDTNVEIHPFILGANATTIARTSVLTVYTDTSLYPRTGSLVETTSSAGTATFSGLHLVKPQKGTYNLTFVSSDSSLRSASVDLEITAGRSNHLGLLPYCATVDGACQTNVNCTCHQYRAASDVAMYPVVVTILDGAFNPVDDLETKACETCPSRRVHLSPQNVTLCRRTGEGNACECAGLASTSSTLHGVSCTSVATFEANTESGGSYFDGLHIAKPYIGTYAVDIHSPGLLGAQYYFSVTLGNAAQLILDETQGSGTFKSKLETSIANASSPLVGRLYDGGGNFISASPTGAQIFVVCQTAELAAYPQGINPLIGGETFAISCGSTTTCATQGGTPGVVEFKNLVLLAPTAQQHDIVFYLNGKAVATYAVTVALGDPAKLVVANSPQGSYPATASTTLGPFEIAIADDAGNRFGSLNTHEYSIIASIVGQRHTFATSGRNGVIAAGTDSTLLRDTVINAPEIGDYVISFNCDNCTALGLSVAPATRTFTITIGTASALFISPVRLTYFFFFMQNINGGLIVQTFTSPASGAAIALQTAYSTAKKVKLSMIQIRVVDAGLNALNLNYEVSVKAERVVVSACNFETNVSYTPQTIVAGTAVFDDIVFYRPCTGTYSLTFSTAGLDSVSTQLTYSAGYPAALDTCTGNSFTRVDRGLCRDPAQYIAAQTLDLRDFVVQMTDPGGYHVGSMWDTEARNITVELFSFVPAEDQPRASVLPTLQAEWDGSLLAVNGGVGWCKDSLDSSPRTVVSSNPTTGAYTYRVVYTNPAPSYCREAGYSGIAPDTHYNVGLHIQNALAGTYRLRFASSCGSSRCPGALYPVLETDMLEFTVVPGAPTALAVVTAPPFINENDFALSPAPVIAAIDSVGNVCVDINTTLTVSVSPAVASISGTEAAMVNGLAKFDSITIIGERANAYELNFSASTLNVSIVPSTPTTVMNCSTVKPNSVLRSGVCECIPGFTADISGGTGYTEDIDTIYVETNITLYKTATSGSSRWLDALHPYGMCVPCKNGFYKVAHGDGACTSCPISMDTSRVDGRLRQTYQAQSGVQLLGALGHVSKSSCHCISQTSVPFESYYRQLPLDDYKCMACPKGAKCYGDELENVEALPGFSRFDRQTLKFRACPYPDACLGGVNSTCLDAGYTGAMCAACANGYAYHAIREAYPPKCYDCSAGAYRVLNFPIVVVNFLWILLLVWLIRVVNQRRSSQVVGMIKSFVTYLQMTALAKNLDLAWPDSMKAFLLIAEKLSLPDIRSASAKCAIGWKFYGNLLFHELLPLGLMIFLFIIFTVIKYVEELREATAQARVEATKKTKANDSAAEDEETNAIDSGNTNKVNKHDVGLEEVRNIRAYDIVISWLVATLWLLYPTLVQYLAEFTQCTGTSGDSDRHFVSDYSVQCRGTAYSLYLFMVIVWAILYIVGIPYGLLQLARGEDIVGEHDSAMVQYRLGLLFKGINVKSAWWWEWVIFARKFILIFIVIVSRRSAVIGGYTVNCMLQLFFVFHIVAKPYAGEKYAKIETHGLLATMATFTGGLIFKQSGEQGGQGSTFVDLITALLFILHAWAWYDFARTLVRQFREEGEEGLIKRAIRDLEFEEAIVDEFDAKRDEEIIHQEKMAKESERIQLRSMTGQRLPFADDDLLETIKADSTITIRQQHGALSSQLQDLRERWKARTHRRGERLIALDERHLTAHSTNSRESPK